MVTISKQAFIGEVNRIENHRITLRSRYIQRIPLFNSLIFSKSKSIAQNSYELQLHKDQFLLK